jgi:transcriptional regulator with XRE-family HTH domain
LGLPGRKKILYALRVITKQDSALTLKRLRGGRTKAQCAREGGVNPNAWTHYEQARRMPSPETQVLIAKGLGITFARLEEELLATRNERLREEARQARVAEEAPPAAEAGDPYQRAVREGLGNVTRELERLFLLTADPKRGEP